MWDYPGLPYLAIVSPLGLVLGAVGLERWGRVKWGQAAILVVVQLAGELVAAILSASVFGLTTPGSWGKRWIRRQPGEAHEQSNR